MTAKSSKMAEDLLRAEAGPSAATGTELFRNGTEAPVFSEKLDEKDKKNRNARNCGGFSMSG
jgi:hypothetical protein